MKYPNIERSNINKGEYLGYANGKIFHIRKSTSSYGNWFAFNSEDHNEQLFAFGLDSLSEKLSKVEKPEPRTQSICGLC